MPLTESHRETCFDTMLILCSIFLCFMILFDVPRCGYACLRSYCFFHVDVIRLSSKASGHCWCIPFIVRYLFACNSCMSYTT
ncbi:hypothetical protein BDV41DRAFT_469327 [Aspergillus transmontanensis]|uniref:Uncharacterized protein n=1 Tax=Aspergillus transmontanensis TaxID=1034304 RepID=A0A5N6VKF2_9EURO|nr:hypothetical protein BDV41DRAFT_469327 [Aspergillus transmontanensis]